jgi:hypothetical protein
MGGSGSGRWGWQHHKATTVEQCLDLDANRWTREGLLIAGIRTSGTWTWTRKFLVAERKDTLRFVVDTIAESPHALLTYTVEGTEHQYRVRLQTTPCFSGARWWFTCPLAVDGQACGRRVGKLYLPPGGKYFGCRRCYRLTYESSQRSDKRVSRIMRNPAALMALAENVSASSPSNLFMYVKVLQRMGLW